MADPRKNDDQAKPKGRKKLVISLVLLNLLGLAGGGAYLVLFQGKESASAQSQTQEASAPGAGEFGPLVEMDPIIANLNDPQAGRYIKVTLHLEAKDEDAAPLIQAAIVPLRNRLLIYFSNLSATDTQGADNKEAIQAQLLAAINQVLGGGDKVRRVFYSEFVVQ